MSDSSTSMSALIICATRAASRSLSPKRISAVAIVSFSLTTGTAPSASSWREGRARVEVAAAFLGVVGRQQDLRDGDAVPAERLLIGMGEADLAGGGGGLLFLEPQRACRRGRDAGGRPRSRPRRRGSPPGRARGSARRRRPARRARRGGSAPSSSTSSAEPILTTSRRARGERFGAAPERSRPSRASPASVLASALAACVDRAANSARKHLRHAGAADAGQRQHRARRGRRRGAAARACLTSRRQRVDLVERRRSPACPARPWP